jgi:hypothetical protein
MVPKSSLLRILEFNLSNLFLLGNELNLSLILCLSLIELIFDEFILKVLLLNDIFMFSS